MGQLFLAVIALFLYGAIAVQFSLNDPVHHFSFNPDLPFTDAIDSFYEIMSSGALRQISPCACFQGNQNYVLISCCGENEGFGSLACVERGFRRYPCRAC